MSKAGMKLKRAARKLPARGSYWIGRDERLTAQNLATARGRIDHVIVVMLENRSFDHLLGFASIPGVAPLDPAACGNPLHPTDPASAVLPSATAHHILALDPPHSHQSAKQQMGQVGARARRQVTYKMNGFVDAYRSKLLRQEHLPIFHWSRIWVGAVGFSVVPSLALREIVHHARAGEWVSFAEWVAGASLVVGGLAWRRPLTRAVGRSRVLGGIVAGGLVLGEAAEGVIRLVRAPQREVVPWLVGGVLVAAVAVLVEQRHDAKKREPPTSDEEAHADECAPRIMGCMAPEQVRVIGGLARDYTLCTRWHSSVPGATWPNRNFLHSGTSGQSVDIEVGFYDDVTVFEMLEDERAQFPDEAPARDPWRIYFDGVPQVIVFEHLLTDDRSAQWRDSRELASDIANEDLPSYTFIEPRHSGGNTNSYHPGNNEKPTDRTSDFARGEELVRTIYTSLRDRPALFEKTLLVVTFDEHGGFFDRASPPRTVHPTALAAVRHPQTTTRRLIAWFVEQRNSPFDFKLLGMRVPAVVVSAYGGPRTVDDVFDHTSVIATLRDLFASHQQPLTKRDRRARPFWDLVLGDLRTEIPDVPSPEYPAETEETAQPDDADDREAALVAPSPITGPADDAPPPYNTGGEVQAQLDHLTQKALTLLDERGAPPSPVAEPRGAREAIAATEPTSSDEVAQRLAAWHPRVR